jgi:DNA-binding XRE family transcriptional regulator
MKNNKLIPLEEAAKEWFTKEEVKELDKKVEEKMEKDKLIPWNEIKKEWFSEEEIKKLDKKVEERIALRKIQELRKELNLTQEALSMKSGIPRSTISKIESGKRNVCFDKLVQIAEALGKDLEIRFVDKEK